MGRCGLGGLLSDGDLVRRHLDTPLQLDHRTENRKRTKLEL